MHGMVTNALLAQQLWVHKRARSSTAWREACGVMRAPAISASRPHPFIPNSTQWCCLLSGKYACYTFLWRDHKEEPQRNKPVLILTPTEQQQQQQQQQRQRQQQQQQHHHHHHACIEACISIAEVVPGRPSKRVAASVVIVVTVVLAIVGIVAVVLVVSAVIDAVAVAVAEVVVVVVSSSSSSNEKKRKRQTATDLG